MAGTGGAGWWYDGIFVSGLSPSDLLLLLALAGSERPILGEEAPRPQHRFAESCQSN